MLVPPRWRRAAGGGRQVRCLCRPPPRRADNLSNKQALNLLGGAKGGLEWTVSMIQLFVGVLWVLPLWGLGMHTAPKLTGSNWWQDPMEPDRHK
jgi:hypothetical protein